MNHNLGNISLTPNILIKKREKLQDKNIEYFLFEIVTMKLHI